MWVLELTFQKLFLAIKIKISICIMILLFCSPFQNISICLCFLQQMHIVAMIYAFTLVEVVKLNTSLSFCMCMRIHYAYRVYWTLFIIFLEKLWLIWIFSLSIFKVIEVFCAWEQNSNLPAWRKQNVSLTGLFVLRGRSPSPSPAPSQNCLRGLSTALARWYFAPEDKKRFRKKDLRNETLLI